LEYELTLIWVLALLISGFFAGFINTLAGGGSMLTLPALMMLGMPADIANATNRVGVLLQSITGVKGFNDQDRLDKAAIGPILVPTLIGALVGALLASYLPVTLLKPILLLTMIGMALIMLIKPAAVIPPAGSQPRNVSDSPKAAWSLFLAGLYGGFIQAGVGFILIAALAGGLRYDLVRTNALKMVCTGVLSFVALLVFVARDQVWWIPGLVLAAGMMAGAGLSVRFTVSVPQTALKWILFVMVCLTCAGALIFD